MQCSKQYFQQKLFLYFLFISNSCEVFIQSRRAQELFENIVVWREVFKFGKIWREGMVLGKSPQVYPFNLIEGIKYLYLFSSKHWLIPSRRDQKCWG
jgi:hypothetical protein